MTVHDATARLVTPTPDPKYGAVRLESVRRCPACGGNGDTAVATHKRTDAGDSVRVGTAREKCWMCDGTGEQRTPILNPGEPFLLIRATDKTAAVMVEVYKTIAEPADTVDIVRWVSSLTKRAEAIREWQEANPGLVGPPD